ncbi:MAG: CPBP family intramembrane metalloprotease [Phycisphaeraceae bacterium]|nr:CPBP family intramembrane metalloprotease [Phycisphaeraceae bacterium]
MIQSYVQIGLAVVGGAVIVCLWRADVVRPGSFGRVGRTGHGLRAMPEALSGTAPGSETGVRAGLSGVDFLIAAAGLFATQVVAAGVAASVVQSRMGGAGAAGEVASAGIERMALIAAVMYPIGLAAAVGAWLALRWVWRARRRAEGLSVADGDPGLKVGKPWVRTLAVSAACTAAVIPVCVLVNLVVTRLAVWIGGAPIDPIAHETLRALMEAWSGGVAEGGGALVMAAPWVVTLSALVAAPIVEELLYRGCVQSGVLGLVRSRWGAILITSVVFTVVHVGATPWYALPGLMVLSVGLGIAYERTGRIGVPILMHVGFNGVNLGVAAAVTIAGGG